MYNIYEDLEGFDIGAKLLEKDEEIQDLESRLNQLVEKYTILEQDKKALLRKIIILEKNASSLLLTAKTELNRVNTNYQNLRNEYENLCFRRKIPLRADLSNKILFHKTTQTDNISIDGPKRIGISSVVSSSVDKNSLNFNNTNNLASKINAHNIFGLRQLRIQDCNKSSITHSTDDTINRNADVKCVTPQKRHRKLIDSDKKRKIHSTAELIKNRNANVGSILEKSDDKFKENNKRIGDTEICTNKFIKKARFNKPSLATKIAEMNREKNKVPGPTSKSNGSPNLYDDVLIGLYDKKNTTNTNSSKTDGNHENDRINSDLLFDLFLPNDANENTDTSNCDGNKQLSIKTTSVQTETQNNNEKSIEIELTSEQSNTSNTKLDIDNSLHVSTIETVTPNNIQPINMVDMNTSENDKTTISTNIQQPTLETSLAMDRNQHSSNKNIKDTSSQLESPDNNVNINENIQSTQTELISIENNTSAKQPQLLNNDNNLNGSTIETVMSKIIPPIYLFDIKKPIDSNIHQSTLENKTNITKKSERHSIDKSAIAKKQKIRDENKRILIRDYFECEKNIRVDKSSTQTKPIINEQNNNPNCISDENFKQPKPLKLKRFNTLSNSVEEVGQTIINYNIGKYPSNRHDYHIKLNQKREILELPLPQFANANLIQNPFKSNDAFKKIDVQLNKEILDELKKQFTKTDVSLVVTKENLSNVTHTDNNNIKDSNNTLENIIPTQHNIMSTDILDVESNIRANNSNELIDVTVNQTEINEKITNEFNEKLQDSLHDSANKNLNSLINNSINHMSDQSNGNIVQDNIVPKITCNKEFDSIVVTTIHSNRSDDEKCIENECPNNISNKIMNPIISKTDTLSNESIASSDIIEIEENPTTDIISMTKINDKIDEIHKESIETPDLPNKPETTNSIFDSNKIIDHVENDVELVTINNETLNQSENIDVEKSIKEIDSSDSTSVNKNEANIGESAATLLNSHKVDIVNLDKSIEDDDKKYGLLDSKNIKISEINKGTNNESGKSDKSTELTETNDFLKSDTIQTVSRVRKLQRFSRLVISTNNKRMLKYYRKMNKRISMGISETEAFKEFKTNYYTHKLNKIDKKIAKLKKTILETNEKHKKNFQNNLNKPTDDMTGFPDKPTDSITGSHASTLDNVSESKGIQLNDELKEDESVKNATINANDLAVISEPHSINTNVNRLADVKTVPLNISDKDNLNNTTESINNITLSSDSDVSFSKRYQTSRSNYEIKVLENGQVNVFVTRKKKMRLKQ